MNEFIDGLETHSKKIIELEERLLELRKKYRKILDSSLREEIIFQEKNIKKEKTKTLMFLYENITELKLIKKHFPAFFSELEKDEGIGKLIEKIKWIIEFTFQKEPLERFEKIKKIRKELSKKDEEQDLKLKQEGWVLILNEPLIDVYIKKYLRCYFSHFNMAKKIENEYKNSQLHLGSAELSEMHKKMVDERKKAKKYEICLKKILYANPDHLKKLKNSKINTSNYTVYEHKFFDTIITKKIDEIKWVEEMDKILKN